MQRELVTALVIGIPIILFPATFVWYLNFGWLLFHAKEAARERRAAVKRRQEER